MGLGLHSFCEGLVSLSLAFRISEVVAVGKGVSASRTLGIHDSLCSLKLDQQLGVLTTHVLEPFIDSFRQARLKAIIAVGKGGPFFLSVFDYCMNKIFTSFKGLNKNIFIFDC